MATDNVYATQKALVDAGLMRVGDLNYAGSASALVSPDGSAAFALNNSGQLVNVAGTGTFASAPQALAGSGALGAVSLATDTTTFATTGAATATLAAGSNGQRKRMVMIVDGGDAVVTITNLQGGTTATFNDANDVLDLQYLDSKWKVITNGGVTIA